MTSYLAATAETSESSVPPPAGLWQRFTEANKRICHGFFQPRIYTISHLSALEWWFRRRAESLPTRQRMLEFGSGRDFPISRMLRDCFVEREGTDLDEVPQEYWPEGVTYRRCSDSRLPFEDGRFDAVVIRSVLEHVADPPAVFKELSRVLKPGGCIFMNLPNKWDYVSVISRCAGPLKSSLLHRLVPGAWDDFPVYYRCNTRGALHQAVNGSGLAVENFRPFPSEPGCLKFFVPFYLAGAVYQFAISMLALDALQPAFLVVLRKGDSQA
jgi:SAM-dependent methyltransferase